MLGIIFAPPPAETTQSFRYDSAKRVFELLLCTKSPLLRRKSSPGSGWLRHLVGMPLSDDPPDHLRRLPRAWYTGHAWVHWSMTIEGRKTGWLDDAMHVRIRELLIHTATRHALVCPAYCLMPDHAHFLWMGVGEAGESDQLAAAAFFRRHWNVALRACGASLQKQGYDHVLDEHERNPDAFEDTVHYIFRNPERAGLVVDWKDWPWLGAVAAGYPDTEVRDGDWLPRFWKLHHAELKKRGFPGA